MCYYPYFLYIYGIISGGTTQSADSPLLTLWEHFARNLLIRAPVVGGFSPPLWKMMDFVSWDDEIPNQYMEKWKIHVPNHQPVIL